MTDSKTKRPAIEPTIPEGHVRLYGTINEALAKYPSGHVPKMEEWRGVPPTSLYERVVPGLYKMTVGWPHLAVAYDVPEQLAIERVEYTPLETRSGEVIYTYRYGQDLSWLAPYGVFLPDARRETD